MVTLPLVVPFWIEKGVQPSGKAHWLLYGVLVVSGAILLASFLRLKERAAEVSPLQWVGFRGSKLIAYPPHSERRQGVYRMDGDAEHFTVWPHNFPPPEGEQVLEMRERQYIRVSFFNARDGGGESAAVRDVAERIRTDVGAMARWFPGGTQTW